MFAISLLALNLLINFLDELMNAPRRLVDYDRVRGLLKILNEYSEVIHESRLWQKPCPLDQDVGESPFEERVAPFFVADEV
jgi:hypothetical protein